MFADSLFFAVEGVERLVKINSFNVVSIFIFMILFMSVGNYEVDMCLGDGYNTTWTPDKSLNSRI